MSKKTEAKKGKAAENPRPAEWHRIQVLGPNCSYLRCHDRASWRVAVPLQRAIGHKYCIRYVCKGHVAEMMEMYPTKGTSAGDA